MSMLSAQCDALRLCTRNLRAIASDSSLVWQASNEMEKAADTIWQLRNQLHTQHAEEERLTEENDELRKFVGDMYKFLMLVHGPATQFERRMRKLGIEVKG